MFKKTIKNSVSKLSYWAVKALPVVIPVLLVLNANSTASIYNGQPIPPSGLKKYRKF